MKEDKSPYLKHIFLCSVLLLLNLVSTNTQAQRLPKTTYKALNNYIIYSNEVTHALNLMYFDFLYLNEQFYNYVEDSIETLVYEKENILTNPDYFPVYPRELYPVVVSENTYLPPERRGAPFALVSKVVTVLKEIEQTRSLLERYINEGAYKNDQNLVQGFKWLRRMEVLYYDMFTLQEKLHWNLSAIIQTYEPPPLDSNALRVVQNLDPLLQQIKTVIKSVRAKDGSKLLEEHCDKLERMIRRLKQGKTALLKGLPLDPQSLRSPDKRLEGILDRAVKVLAAGRAYSKNPQYRNLDFKPYYYYYNIDLLDHYNRSGNGAVVLYNRFINDQDVYWLYEHEMPHMFQVLYPDVPEFEQFKAPTINIDSIINQHLTTIDSSRIDSIEQARIDSIAQARIDSIAQAVADSIAYRQANPEIGDMNLNGFADNNLVFLLDISSSMKDTNKLPLLKEALVQLLDLMRKEDNITFITYSGKAQVVLKRTSAQSVESKSKILSVIDNLASSGQSDANKGLKLAYKTIMNNVLQGGNNRIILATDGGIKISRKIKRLIRKSAQQKKDPIRLSVFYFSKKEYSHHKNLLQELSETGGGKYSYIKKENAKQILVIEAQEVRKKQGAKRRKKSVQ